MRNLRHNHWRVVLIYLALPDVNVSIRRVAERVAHGGHHIPEVDIRRRFPRSLRNLLQYYSAAADQTFCYLNTRDTPSLVFEQQGPGRGIANLELFQQLSVQAKL